MLDARAKAPTAAGSRSSRAEVDDADACADLERAARARHELDRLVEELARATGLAGTIRSFADDAERARVSVRKAIKRALAMIAAADPALGRPARGRLVTGTRCVYRLAY